MPLSFIVCLQLVAAIAGGILVRDLFVGLSEDFHRWAAKRKLNRNLAPCDVCGINPKLRSDVAECRQCLVEKLF